MQHDSWGEKVKPLHLVVMRAGVKSYARLQEQLERKQPSCKSNMLQKNRHRTYWEKLVSEANIELSNSDTICETIREKKYKVNLKSFEGKKNTSECRNTMCTQTDAG